MQLAQWTVVPDLRPWRGDMRRNPAPYYIGAGMSLNELVFAQSVKRILESRGIACHVQLIWEDINHASVYY